ncbi:unnamed protein product [Caenorhabditis brenneri]
MPIVQTNSGDPPSGITINNYNQQDWKNFCGKRTGKKLTLYFCIGFALSSVLAIVAYGSTLGVFELLGLFSSKEKCNKRVIGYHRLWLPYNETDSQLSKLTHLVFDRAKVDKNGTIYFSDLDKQKKFMEANKRARRFGVKTLISFFVSQELIETGARRELIDSIVNFTHDNHLDGLEISSQWISSKKGYQNAFELFKELRKKFRTLNNVEFIISLGVTKSGPYIATKDLLKYVDFVNILIFSYYAPFLASDSELIGPPTPLYSYHANSTKQNLNQDMRSYSCISGIPSKLNMMLEFKGYYWKNVIPPSNSSDTLWMTAEIKNYTAEGIKISWKDLKNSEVWDISKASWNHESKTPYIWSPENRTYLAFENERSIDEKMKYAMYKNFGGVTIHVLHEDDDEDSLLNIVSSEQWCLSETKARFPIRSAKLSCEKILSELDFKTLLILRKVSSDFRDFIDNVRPISNLTDIIITIYPYKIRFNLEPHTEFAQIEYKKHHQGSLICWYDEKIGYKQEKFMRKEDFVKLAVNDLDVYLNLVKPVLPSLRIIFKPAADYGEEKDLRENDTMRNTANYFLRLLRTKLKTRAHPLQVKAFTMKSETLKQHQVMSVLPYLKSKSLETIEFLSDSPFFQAFQHRDREKIDLDALVGLEQWKRAKCVKNLNFSETIPIKEYKHLKSAHFIFQSLSSEYLRDLKEVILDSSVFKYCKIEFLYFHDVYHLQKLFGKSIISENRKSKQWYFWNPLEDYAIMLVLSRLRFLEFSWIELSKIPKDANVI